ncbi:MAG: hypothetical protein ACPGYK_04125 [Flavobacteriales bacterium]
MHELEPYFAWRNHYVASEDPKSPFFDRQYSEFEFSTQVYNYYIHPQWDGFGSNTLLCKILFVDYEERFAVLEFIGEWNDCLHNDIMLLKREVIDSLQAEGVTRFVLIGENVLNFHHSDDCYYEEWFEEVMDEDGWIALLNFREHVLADMKAIDLDSYFVMGGELDELNWRTFSPHQLYQRIEDCVTRRLTF